MTNLEKIRQMSDEELANWLRDLTPCGTCPAQYYCAEHLSEARFKAWLNSEVEE